jgi:methionyl-tRNA synthetase
MKKKFYITTAIDYVNAKPHIGHAFEKTLADAVARWHRLIGENVFFLTGVDENAQKNVQAAEKAGIPVKKFIDTNSGFFLELCQKLNISYDAFVRTTAKEHGLVVQKIVKKIIENGDVYKSKYKGYYCIGCEAFITEKDLVNGKCPEHNKEPEFREEDAYFFKLSKYQKQLLKLIPGYVLPESRKNEILSRVKEGLDDICISRKEAVLGVDFPGEKDFKVYVWIDALINYISGLKEKEKQYWPADVHIIGKGINWFHSVIWPAILLSAGYKLPKKLLVHGYLNLEGKKISKSLGNTLDPLEFLKKYQADTVRYSLLRCSVFDDSDYSEQILIERHNGELANKLGNLVSRVAGMCKGKIPKSSIDPELASKLKLTSIFGHMNNFTPDRALAEIFEFIDKCNEYVQQKQPWTLEGKEKDKMLYSLVDSIRIISILLYPFMPETSEKIMSQFNFPKPLIADALFGKTKDGKINKSDILFEKIE